MGACRGGDRCETIGCQQRSWIAWDDNIGVHVSNPHCGCGIPSRRDYAGRNSYVARRMFWTCADGTCNYLSYNDCCYELNSYKDEQFRFGHSIVPYCIVIIGFSLLTSRTTVAKPSQPSSLTSEESLQPSSCQSTTLYSQ